jgi:hypothetical protein
MEKREKTIQVKVSEKQKKQIEKFISEVSVRDNIRYTVSSYILKIVLEKMNDKMEKKVS